MEKDAIVHVEQNALAAEFNQKILSASEIDVPFVMVPDGYSVQDLEEFYPERRSFRAKLETSNPEAFLAYCAENGPADVFVNSEGMMATAIFDLGDQAEPGHARHRANLKLKPTAAFKAIENIDGQPMDQRTMAEWIEDWSHMLVPWTEETELTLTKAIDAIRRVVITRKHETDSETRNFGATRSTLEQVDARSRDMELPKGLTAMLQPYAGLASREFQLRLSLSGSDKPVLKLRLVRMEEQQEEMAEELLTTLRNGLDGDKFNLKIGTLMV